MGENQRRQLRENPRESIEGNSYTTIDYAKWAAYSNLWTWQLVSLVTDRWSEPDNHPRAPLASGWNGEEERSSSLFDPRYLKAVDRLEKMLLDAIRGGQLSSDKEECGHYRVDVREGFRLVNENMDAINSAVERDEKELIRLSVGQAFEQENDATAIAKALHIGKGGKAEFRVLSIPRTVTKGRLSEDRARELFEGSLGRVFIPKQFKPLVVPKAGEKWLTHKQGVERFASSLSDDIELGSIKGGRAINKRISAECRPGGALKTNGHKGKKLLIDANSLGNYCLRIRDRCLAKAQQRDFCNDGRSKKKLHKKRSYLPSKPRL